jgi:hypothetical protein
VRSITIAVGASIFCAIVPVGANAKIDRSTCEQRCEEYYCSGGGSMMYCHYACHKKCPLTVPNTHSGPHAYRSLHTRLNGGVRS